MTCKSIDDDLPTFLRNMTEEQRTAFILRVVLGYLHDTEGIQTKLKEKQHDV